MVEIPKNDSENMDIDNALNGLKGIITTGKLSTLENTIVSQENKEATQKIAKESMTKIGEIFKINIPFLGEIGNLFGTKWPIDLLGTKEERRKNKVLNGILKVFGFKNGMEEVHQLYIENEIKGIDKELAKDAFKEYKTTEKTELTDTQKTRNICGLDKIFATMKDEDKTNLQNKIPQDYEGLKTTLIKQIPNHINKLNINTVNMVNEAFIGIDENNQKIIKFDEIQKDIPGFIDAYLKLTIPALANPENEFIDGKNTNVDTFAYALFGNLTGEKFFVEAVNLGIEKIPAIATSASIANSIETNTEKRNLSLENKKLNELTFEEAKILAKRVFGEGPATDLLVVLSKQNPAMILRSIALAKHEGELKFGLKNDDPNKQSAQINIGTFQISAKRGEITDKRNKNLEIGENLLKQNNIAYEEGYFKKLKNYHEETGDSLTKKAQTDLLIRLGFIQNERGGEKTLKALADNNLKPNEVQNLMSTTIQGGISAIGKDVVAQINTAKTDQYTQLT